MRAFFLAVLVANAVACGAASDASDKQIDVLRGEITRLQAEQDHLGSRLTAIESSDGRPLVPAAEQPKPSAANREHAALRVVVVKPGNADDDDDDSPPAVDGQATEHVSDVGDIGHGRSRTKAIAPSKEYENALSLAKKKSYPEAIDAFTAFLMHNPDHPNADNALFWIGSCQLDNGDAPKAIESLEGMLARFPKGNKVPDALLKLSVAYKKQGDDAKAAAALARLRTEFSTSDAAHRAPKGLSMSRTSLGLLIGLGFVVAVRPALAVDDPGPPDDAGPTTTVTTTQAPSTTTTATTFVPYGLPSPGGKSQEAHLESSSHLSTDASHSSDGFDLGQPGSGGGITLHGDKDAAGVFSGGSALRNADVHVVRRGDTLWDISSYYHHTPYDWPRLWSYNPNIQNPHWIYPGDHVRLHKPGEETGDRAPVVMGLGKSTVNRETVFLRDEGFLDNEQKDSWGTVSGSPEDVMLLAEGDVVYLDMKKEDPVKLGDELTVFHSVRSGPKGQGAVVRIFGTARVDSYDNDTHIARATLTESLDPIERGMAVGPVGRKFDVVPPVRNDVELSAHIIASVSPRVFHGRDQVVFLDVGGKDGLVPGNRLFVLRRGDPWRAGLAGAGDLSDQTIKMNSTIGVENESVRGTARDKDYPDEIVGELRVLRTRDHNATCLVTASKKELTEGDLAIARKGY